MGRIFTIALAVFVAHSLLAPSPVMAQPQNQWTSLDNCVHIVAGDCPAEKPDQWGSLVGNWNLEFLGKDRTPLANGLFAFQGGAPSRHLNAGGLVSETTGEYKPCRCEGSFEGGTVELECGTYGFLTHFKYLTLRPSADGNALSGTWRSTATEPEGFVRLTRARPPAIEKVEVLSIDGEERPDYNRGDPGKLRIRVEGRDLPNWVGSAVWAWQEISIDDPTFRIVRGDGSTHDLRERWRQGYLDVIVATQPGARPGRKTITVNGSSKTFDVVFRNYEDSKVVELRFVRKDGSPLSEIAYGEPFHVEARFDVPPSEDERIVKLDWDGGAMDIPVIKQKDAKVFRSGVLYLEAPTTSTETPNKQ